MDTYIMRQPILNQKEKTEAYELIYEKDSTVFTDKKESRIANAIVAFFNMVDSEEILENKDVFITFTPNLLLQNIPKIFDEKKIIIQIEESALMNSASKAVIHEYRNKGYRFALCGFGFNKRCLEILPLIDYVKIDFLSNSDNDIQSILTLAKMLGKKTIACDINTAEDKKKATDLNFDYIQGDCVGSISTGKVHSIDKLESNFFRLMAALTKEEPDFDEISQMISVDVNLTYSLLKLVNSAYFSLPNKIQSVKQALTVLGLGQLKQWAYLLSFSPDGGIKDEVIKISLLRGIFCEKLHGLIKNPTMNKSEAYLLGMFSTLDVLLEVSLKDAITELPLSQELKNGLLGEPGMPYNLLQLCIAYEKGKWIKLDKFAKELGLTREEISEKYFESVDAMEKMWKNVNISAAD